MPQAGGVLLTEAVRIAGLHRRRAAKLAAWHRPLAVHSPAKVLCNLVIALALGADCLADVALLRAEPDVYGLVASDPTVGGEMPNRTSHRRHRGHDGCTAAAGAVAGKRGRRAGEPGPPPAAEHA